MRRHLTKAFLVATLAGFGAIACSSGSNTRRGRGPGGSGGSAAATATGGAAGAARDWRCSGSSGAGRADGRWRGGAAGAAGGGGAGWTERHGGEQGDHQRRARLGRHAHHPDPAGAGEAVPHLFLVRNTVHCCPSPGTGGGTALCSLHAMIFEFGKQSIWSMGTVFGRLFVVRGVDDSRGPDGRGACGGAAHQGVGRRRAFRTAVSGGRRRGQGRR